jgi:hypothetical protein
LPGIAGEACDVGTLLDAGCSTALDTTGEADGREPCDTRCDDPQAPSPTSDATAHAAEPGQHERKVMPAEGAFSSQKRQGSPNSAFHECEL